MSSNLKCGHPAACDGLAGENGDQPGCGWCADIKDNRMLIDHLTRTYDHFSRGRVSKPNTLPDEVFVIASDFDNVDTAEIERDERDRIRTELINWLIGRLDPKDAGLINGRRITAEIDRICPKE